MTSPKSREGKYLTFRLAGEAYGVGILKIQEILGMVPIRSVPRTPAYFKGVVDLRGRVVPVFDLRLRLGMEAAEYNDRRSIRENDVEDFQALGSERSRNHILGMAKIEGDVVILLDTDHVFSGVHETGPDQLEAEPLRAWGISKTNGGL